MEIAKKRMQTCCFTGHRELPPEEQAEIASRLERVIVALYQKGIRYYGAGGALGFDALAARTVICLRKNCPGMKLILVLPCLTQTRGWRPEDVAEYERIKAQADKVVYTARASRTARVKPSRSHGFAAPGITRRHSPLKAGEARAVIRVHTPAFSQGFVGRYRRQRK